MKHAATKESHFLICVDSQIVLTTQPVQSLASSSVLLAASSNTTILTGNLQLRRKKEGGVRATTAASAASFPPSLLRVGDRGRALIFSGGHAPSSFLFPTLQPLVVFGFEAVISAVPLVAASIVPQSILTHPVCMTRIQQPRYYQVIATFCLKCGRVAYSGVGGSVACRSFLHGLVSILYFRSCSCLYSNFRLIPVSVPKHVKHPAAACPSTLHFLSSKWAHLTF